MIYFLQQAALMAIPSHNNDKRAFWLGCIGIREDNAIVCAKNGAVEFHGEIENYQLVPSAHAEGRVLRKLGKNGIIFVARISKKDHSWAMARPCRMCRVRIKSFKVRKVFYTIDPSHYGIWYPHKNFDKIIDI
jgi:cytidine deaminase